MAETKHSLLRALTLTDAIALVVGTVTGTGVFLKTAVINWAVRRCCCWRGWRRACSRSPLSEKDAALHAGRRATELLPMSQDVLSCAWYLYQLAQLEAQFGDHESAC